MVVLIQSDPRSSHRACEGIRIALGLAASEHHVTVLLTKHAVRLLQKDKTDWIDEERLEHFLSAFEGFPNTFFIDAASAETDGLSEHDAEAPFLSQSACAEKIAQTDCFFSF